ncbi:MAG: sensor histidine kinase [Blastocatellia bacterium]
MSEFSTIEQPNDNKTRNTDWSPDEFLAMVSHELRNPTWVILGWAEVISRRPVNAETLARAIEVIKRNAQLQAKLINQLLDFSRINSGGFWLDSQNVTLLSILESAIETMTIQAMAKTIELRVDLERSAATVIGDPVRLQQVFTNLLSNAIKFTPHGGRVEIRYECIGNYAEITVSDTGRGISAEFLPYVFDRFRQETVETAGQGGLGLGLAIARYLVEEHGGMIYVNSRGEGKGTTFTVCLPLESHAVRESAQREGAAESLSNPISGRDPSSIS